MMDDLDDLDDLTEANYDVNECVEVVYDTSLRTATRAAHGGLLIGGTKAPDTQASWTKWFTWFGTPEHITLRPQRELLYCYVCSSS
jgi:hypothetical protein